MHKRRGENPTKTGDIKKKKEIKRNLHLPRGMSPLLSMDSLMVLGMETRDTEDVAFFFFGFSST